MQAYLPMTETMYLILLSILTPIHGYGVLLRARRLARSRRDIPTGTIYNSLRRLCADGLAVSEPAPDGRALYTATERGVELLRAEVERLGVLYEAGRESGLSPAAAPEKKS
jgi:DNA-binding PadR family transcriptional regulator